MLCRNDDLRTAARKSASGIIDSYFGIDGAESDSTYVYPTGTTVSDFGVDGTNIDTLFVYPIWLKNTTNIVG